MLLLVATAQRPEDVQEEGRGGNGAAEDDRDGHEPSLRRHLTPEVCVVRFCTWPL